MSAFRIAVRHEGNYVNAYVAAPDTMEEAVLVMSTPCNLLEEEAIFQEWLVLVKKLVTARLGVPNISWRDVPAPEHERTGSA